MPFIFDKPLVTSFLDIQAIAHLIPERGDQLQICQELSTPGDPAYGIPPDITTACSNVFGYAVPSETSLLPTTPAFAGTDQQVSYTLYLLARDFDPSVIVPTTTFKVDGFLYQIEQDATPLHREHPVLYVYKLKPKSRTVSR